jgi:4-amino-4-deoxy-L-arabinose transferase-like glycosyltransferase
MLKPVWLRRLALVAIAALAGLSYGWSMGQGTLEYYYGAAVRSMSMSWHDFIFGSFDPAGTVTLDKLPGAFWLQALSVRAFGFHPWAIVLPQVVEGILTVLVLYRAVSRLAGPTAGLIAALVLAASPAAVALDRGNISDSLMILLLVLAADAVSAAIARSSMDIADEYPDLADEDAEPADGNDELTGRDDGATDGPADDDEELTDEDEDEDGVTDWRTYGTTTRLVLAGFWVGLAFQAKMIEAWMVLPALGLAYLVCGPGPVVRRVVQLTVAGVVVAVVSLSWMTAVSLVPAADRPYFDGSHDNSIYTQVFVYNAFGRFGDQTPLQVAAAELNPGSVLAIPAPTAGRLLHGGFGRDTGWLLPAAAVIGLWGLVSRRRQPRGDPLRACFILWGGWLVTLFAVFSAITTLNSYYTAALAPPAAALIGAGAAAAWSRDRAAVSRRIGLALVVAGTAAYSVWLVPSSGFYLPGWLVPVIIAVAVAAIGVILWSLRTRRDTWFAGALTAGLIAMALAPAVASASLVASDGGAFAVPFERVTAAEDLARVTQVIAEGPQAVLTFREQSNGAPIVLAAQAASLPSIVIYVSGLEALPIGGFDGTTPVPTLDQLKADVSAGRFNLVWIAAASNPRLQWIATHCFQESKRYYSCVPSDAGQAAAGGPTPAPVQR